MKKIMKVTQRKRFLSLILAVVMMATVFNMALPVLKLDASAATTDADGNIVIDGVTQKRVVDVTDDEYKATYSGYVSEYLNGSSVPTDIVIPGLDPDEDYVIQGMTYYPERDWMLVTAYHNDETASSKVFAIEATTGDFVAMFSFLNPDGTTNMDHGGGIAISENNLYYSCGDKDRMIAYAPLSAIDNAPEGEHTVIQLAAKHEFFEVGNVTTDGATAYTAYVCYDEGVLWMGNFYDEGAIGGAIAADYKIPAHSSWDNMVWGYRLEGSSSEEEWLNLTNADGSDCQGSPTYAIALGDEADLDIKQVQYATVHDGKLYLSRSYGSGTGNSVTFGFDDTSHFTIANIDLSTPGTGTLDIIVDSAGTTKTLTDVYLISEYDDYTMMAMSEGLCVINDYVFVTFEGASNKYMNESSGAFSIGNTDEPVDVVWKIDQYGLVGMSRAENRKTVCYERVDDISSINNTDEYIIISESSEKNPVTQEKILYALDSHGGHDGYYLPKEGLNNPDHTVGIVGHEISYYDLDGNKLYLTYPEEDDVANIRWKFTGSNGSYQLVNSSRYFSKYNTLHISGVESSMAMSTTTAMTLTDLGETWYIQANGQYMWCNDGTHNYEDTINSYYTNYYTSTGVSAYTEQAGTFHSDATGTTNVLGRAFNADEYVSVQFKIYKRVIDEYASTEESRVFTDMTAELQEDGTYTINLETYATAEIQYQTLAAERPTDFIFVLDTSASMTNNSDCSGYQQYTGDLSAYSIANDSTSPGDTDAGTWSGPIYMRIPGTSDFANVSVEASSRGKSGCDYYKYFWIYYTYNGTTYYWKPTSTTDASQGGTWVTTKPAESETMYVQANSDSDRAKAEIYRGEHYRYYESSDTDRLSCMKTAMGSVINKIVSNANSTGFDHRFAIVQYGSDGADDVAWLNTGMYTNTSTTMVQYTGEGTIGASTYANAFYNTNQTSSVHDIIWAMTTTGGDSDTFSNYGFDMANGIINNSGKDYYASGDRSVAIVMITDGVPGKGSDDVASAKTVGDLTIREAYEAKSKGASVYTIQMGNNSIDGFSMDSYMEAVSSEYVTAKTRLDLGDRNPDSIDYSTTVATGTANMFDVIADNIFSSTSKNSTAGFAILDADTIIREELEDAFIVPSTAQFTASFIPTYYDKVGRVSFGEPVSKTIEAKEKYEACTEGNIAYYYDNSTEESSRKIEIWGFDYAQQYISTSHAGNKLRLSISGVLANEDADLTNTSINNHDNTAIYTDSTWINNGRAFKYFPTEYFTIPKYTYVLDYGLQMLDTDVNGTLKSVSVDLSAQRDADGNLAYKTESENGLVQIADNSLDLLYSTTPTNFSDSGYCLIQRDDGTYDWFEIEVVPGSNVLFEEDAIELADDTIWESEGESAGTYQDLTNNEEDVYGYDSTYASSTGFSNGTYYFAKVDSANNKRSDTATFTFKGTSFDLIGACGKYTGIQVVQIDKKVYIVDTFCDDANLLDSNNLIYQVPIVNWTGDYGEHTVKVTAAYFSYANGAKTSYKNNKIDTGLEMSSAKFTDRQYAEALLESAGITDVSAEDVELIWFDDNSVLNGGTGVAAQKNGSKALTENGAVVLHNYIDGIRVYNPLGNEVTENYDPYADYRDTEKNASYANVISHLATLENDATELNGIAYVTGSLAEGETLKFANYQSVGPQNELYLNGEKSVSFKINVAENERVMLGLRAVKGEVANINITSVDSNGTSTTYTVDKVSSATEMYYDVTNCLSENIKANGGEVTITVNNANSSNVLAINHIKFSGAESSFTGGMTARSVSRSGVATETVANRFLPMTQSDLDEIQNALAGESISATIKNGVVVPIVDDDTTGDDTTGDNTTGDDTTGDNTTSNTFDIFSLLEMLLAFIEKILHSAFGTGNLF